MNEKTCPDATTLALPVSARQTQCMHTLPAAARDLDLRIRDQIPLTRAIALAITAWDGDTLVMDAPLAPNRNDKGCAFGGSLTSTMTVAGWALVTLALEQHGLDCDVFVGSSEVAYLTPVWQDFQAQAELDEGADWNSFFRTLRARGKARITVSCHVHERGNDARCATLTARFVAKQREPSPDKPAADAAQ